MIGWLLTTLSHCGGATHEPPEARRDAPTPIEPALSAPATQPPPSQAPAAPAWHDTRQCFVTPRTTIIAGTGAAALEDEGLRGLLPLHPAAVPRCGEALVWSIDECALLIAAEPSIERTPAGVFTAASLDTEHRASVLELGSGFATHASNVALAELERRSGARMFVLLEKDGPATRFSMSTLDLHVGAEQARADDRCDLVATRWLTTAARTLRIDTPYVPETTALIAGVDGASYAVQLPAGFEAVHTDFGYGESTTLFRPAPFGQSCEWVDVLSTRDEVDLQAIGPETRPRQTLLGGTARWRARPRASWNAARCPEHQAIMAPSDAEAPTVVLTRAGAHVQPLLDALGAAARGAPYAWHRNGASP